MISYEVAALCSFTAVLMVPTMSLTLVITSVISLMPLMVPSVLPWMLAIFFRDLRRGLAGLFGQFLDLVGHNGKPFSRLSGPGRLDGGVEGQQVDL
jgi:hypothetical protein